MPYEFTPLVLPYAVALAVTAVLWRRLWRHRNRRAAKGFLLDVTGVVSLSAVLILKLTATDVATKLFWWNWRFLAVSFMSIGYMLMAVEYTDNEDLIDRRVGAGLVVVVVLTQVAAWTNGRDGLLYSSGDLQNGLLVPSFGPLYWVYAFLMVSCIVVGVSLLVNLFRARDGFRVQTAVLVGTVTLVMTGVVLWWGGVIPIDVLALTSTVKVVGFYVAVDRLQLLEALPVARTTVFQNMEDAVFVLNERGQVVDVNPAAKSLVDGRNVTGESIDDALAVDVAADVVAASTGSAASDALENRQIALEYDSGMRYYGLKLSQFSDGTGVVAVFRDVTERRNREQEITVLNRIVRHDIRNEMNVLHGRGQLLKPHLDAAAEDDYRLVMESAQHVVDITETVRNLMKAITSDSSMNSEPVSLPAVLDAEVAKARSNFPGATVELSHVPPLTVNGNELLSSVFTNLLNNAVIHNDADDPRVWVDCVVDDGTVSVTVADDGDGVPMGQRDEIFGRGQKGVSSEGTGVGLYLVDTLTNEFGGDVWVEDAEQGGAAFVVELQVAETNAGDVEDASAGGGDREDAPVPERAGDGGDD